MDVTLLCEESELIVEGIVTDQYSYWNNEKNFIFTTYHIQIYNILKGEYLEEVYVEIEGGIVGLTRIEVYPSVKISRNSYGIFFLRKEKDIWTIAGGKYGFKSISNKGSKDSITNYLLRNNNTCGGRQAISTPAEATFHIHKQSLVSISNISPLSVSAGKQEVLTITGSGFGQDRLGKCVLFPSSDDGGETYIKPLSTQYLLWSENEIHVQVPSDAGSGIIGISDGDTVFSTESLNIAYALINLPFEYNNDTTAYLSRHIALNNNGSISFSLNEDFASNATASESFQYSLNRWKCETGINWEITDTSLVNIRAQDDVNIVRFANQGELPFGVIGKAYSYFNACLQNGELNWYISEIDVIFSSETQWNYDFSAPNINESDFISIALHELGHALQLSHVIDEDDLMHYSINQGQMKRDFSAGNIDGVSYMMGLSQENAICGMNQPVLFNGECGSPPDAKFTVAQSIICADSSFSFIDLSTENPTSWHWEFQGGNPSESFERNPTNIKFPFSGPFEIALTVSNNNGTSIKSKQIDLQINNLDIRLSSNNLVCFGQSDGSAEIYVNDLSATPPFTIQWSNGENTEVISNLQYGIYTVTVTDSIGCSKTDSVEVQNTVPFSFHAEVQPINYGNSEGEIIVHPTDKDGISMFSISWEFEEENVGSGTIISSSHPGFYRCIITHISGCTQDTLIELPIEYAFQINVDSISHNKCQGDRAGSISVSQQGGLEPVQFIWSNGDTLAHAINLPAGWYTVTVTDAEQNIAIETISILQPDSLASTFITNQPLCFGDSNASIKIDVVGGTGDYRYNWSTGSNSDSLLNLSAGTYAVTVTDENSCTATDSIKIASPTSIGYSKSVQQANCNSELENYISYLYWGGTNPLSIEWNGPSNFTSLEDSIFGLESGLYTVFITDSNNCSLSDSTVILNSSLPSVHTDSIIGVSCYMANDGSILLSCSEEVEAHWDGPYNFSANTLSIENLAPGDYNLEISINDNCTQNKEYSVPYPEVLLASIREKKDVSCAGKSDGMIEITVSGGTKPYSYHWTGLKGTAYSDSILTSVPADFYTVTITDAQGCEQTLSRYVHEPDPLQISLEEKQNQSCAEISDGSINIDVTGGTPPYSYNWYSNDSLISHASKIRFLSQGEYKIEVHDNHHCVTADTISISKPDNFYLNLEKVKHIPCIGENSGEIALEIIGIDEFSILWTGPDDFHSNNLHLINLKPGIYTAIVHNELLCYKNIVVEINEEPEIFKYSFPFATDSIISTNAYQIELNGNANKYFWNETEGSRFYTVNKSELLKIRVENYNGCYQTKEVYFSILNEVGSRQDRIEINCSPSITRGDINISGHNLNVVEVCILSSSGFETLAQKEVCLPAIFDISEFPDGIYFIQIKLANGSSYTEMIMKE